MASFLAVETVCQAIIQMLEASFQGENFNSDNLEFEVYSGQDFQSGMTAGVSLYLYRILINDAHRIPTGRIMPDGKRKQTQLPLDLQFLLTAWGAASLQHRIAGWMMRIVEDFPIIPAAYLNTVAPGVFKSNENVEVVQGELSNEDLFHLWESLHHNKYQLSIPYVARNVRIESTQEYEEGIPIHERKFKLYKLQDSLVGF